MSINILADFTDNGIDKNEPHIVLHTDNEYVAGEVVKQKLESQGYVVQALSVVKGTYTLDELHDMANYGIGLDQAESRMIYVSAEAIECFRRAANNPAVAEEMQREIKRRCAAATKRSSG